MFKLIFLPLFLCCVFFVKAQEQMHGELSIDGQQGNYLVFLKLKYGADDLERGYHFIYTDQTHFAAASDALQSIAQEKTQKVGDFYLLGNPNFETNILQEKWMFNFLLAIDRFRAETNIFTIQRNSNYNPSSKDFAAELAKVKNRFQLQKGKTGLCDFLNCSKKQKKLPFPYSTH